MKKRFLPIFITACMILSLMPSMAFAEINDHEVTESPMEVLDEEDYIKDKSKGVFNSDVDATQTPIAVLSNEEAVAGDEYGTLKDLVESATGDITIKLLKDVTLEESISVPNNIKIIINGNNNSINFSGSGTSNSAFEGDLNGLEGLKPGTNLTVNKVNFVGAGQNAGYAVIIGFDSDGTVVSLNDCTFSNLYSAVYANPVTESEVSYDLSITDCKYEDTLFGYSIDEITNGSQVGSVDVEFNGNISDDGFTETEDWPTVIVESQGGTIKAYNSWSAAIEAAKNGDTIILNMDIKEPIVIDKEITLIGNEHTISVGGANTAITISANNVKLDNVSAQSDAGIALVVSEGRENCSINLGSYETATMDNKGKQGEGAIRFMGDNGDISVSGATLTGGLHILFYKEGKLNISGNKIGFTVVTDTALVGILITSPIKDTAKNVFTKNHISNNIISLPNLSSYYTRSDYMGTSWEDVDSHPASESVAKIGNAYYAILADAISVVEDGGTITLLKNSDEHIIINRATSFTLVGENGAVFSGKIKADVGFSLTKKGDMYTIVVDSGGGDDDDDDDNNSGGGGGSSSTYYKITVDDMKYGEIISSSSKASKGANITLTITPDEGYELEELIVTDSKGNELTLTKKNNKTYTFKMPSSKVEINASFVKIDTPVKEVPGTPTESNSLPFTDVSETDWFYDAVKYAYDNNLISGVSEHIFDTNSPTTRGMIVTILHRLEGKPEAGEFQFKDVDDGKYYTDAVAWAAENNIVAGYSADIFAPMDNITREQLAAIFYRYASYKGYDVTLSGDLSAFSDSDTASDYAVDALTWATANKLISGKGNGILDPASPATRAEMATILKIFITTFDE